MSNISTNRAVSPQPTAQAPARETAPLREARSVSPGVADGIDVQTPPRVSSPVVGASGALTPPARPASPRTRAVTHLTAVMPDIEDTAALAERDVRESNGRLTQAFSQQPHDPRLRQRGLALALQEKFAGPLPPALARELNIIRVVRSIDAARDSILFFRSSNETHEQAIAAMPFMAGILRTSIDTNRQCIAEQEESLAQDSAYLAMLLDRPE